MTEVVEIWKEVVGYEEYYRVSNLGNVYSLISNKQLSPAKNASGYMQLTLKGGKSVRVHRLVAEAFIPNPNNYPEVNHIDCNKINNKLENLEWVTPSMNIQHNVKMENRPNQKGSTNWNSKLTEEDVIEIRKLKGKMRGKDIAKKYNVAYSIICRIWQRVIWKHI